MSRSRDGIQNSLNRSDIPICHVNRRIPLTQPSLGSQVKYRTTEWLYTSTSNSLLAIWLPIFVLIHDCCIMNRRPRSQRLAVGVRDDKMIASETRKFRRLTGYRRLLTRSGMTESIYQPWVCTYREPIQVATYRYLGLHVQI